MSTRPMTKHASSPPGATHMQIEVMTKCFLRLLCLRRSLIDAVFFSSAFASSSSSLRFDGSALPLVAATFFMMATHSSTRPMDSSQRGDSGRYLMVAT